MPPSRLQLPEYIPSCSLNAEEAVYTTPTPLHRDVKTFSGVYLFFLESSVSGIGRESLPQQSKAFPKTKAGARERERERHREREREK
jgi:hypothetical protein